MQRGCQVEVLVEVPRGGRLKRRPDGRLQYISPWPAPFDYGAVPEAPLAEDGDPQDAFVLGPGHAAGARVRGAVVGVVRVLDDGVRDDKWLVAPEGLQPTAADRARLERFFWRYQLGKRVLAVLRGTGPARVIAFDWGERLPGSV